jgi:Zn-dependent protease with chaperone function
MMDAYSGKYYLQGGEEQPATMLLMKDKISIGIYDEHGNPRVVFWPYKQIIRENFWRRGMAIVRFGTYPIQSIEVESKEFADRLEKIFKENEKSWIRRVMNKNAMGMIKVLLAFFVLLAAMYFFLVPYMAEKMARKVPLSFEEKLGNGIYDALKTGFTIDEKKTAYINEFFRELKIPTSYTIHITVIKEDVANAFAMPGGNIVVHDKILAGMNNYEDLAALLSHEFTHVNNKHTTRSLFRQLGSTLFLSVLVGDLGAMGNVIISNADNLKGMSYSRKLEKEADMNGLEILNERKIDCNGFVRLFQFLKKESEKADIQPAEWISSHPDLDKRIDYIQSHELFNKNGAEMNELLKVLFLKIKTGD